MPLDQDTKPAPAGLPRVAVLGTLPPLRAISSYCDGLVTGLVKVNRVEFISFAHLYPKTLYPGAALEDEETPPPSDPNLSIRRELSWFNPYSWVRAGLRLKSPLLILQWWSLPLSPVFVTVALVARLRGIRVITTLHNITPHSGRSFWYSAVTRLILKLSQNAIVHSDRNAQQLADELGYPAGRTLVLPMGAPDYRRGRVIDPAASRRHLALPAERPVLLMFGAVRDYKGLDIALEATKYLVESTPQALLLIAGQSWLEKSVHQATVEQMGLTDHVRLDLDYIPDEEIHHYFSAADVLLLPYTHFDAQSGVGVAALPYGLPAIVSDLGSLPDLVRDPDSVVRPSDARQLAERLRAVLASPELQARLSADAAELGRHRDWPSIARDLSRQLGELEANHPEGTAD